MVEIRDAFPESEPVGWTKRRVIFVGLSASLAVALCIAVREVLLPFILAMIIAYVLTPLVAWGESRLRMPRGVSIIVVYVVVLGTVGIGVASIAPRIFHETVAFARDVPSLSRRIASNYGPQLERWVNAYQAKDAVPEATEKKPAFSVVKQGQDFIVEIGEGVEIVEDEKGHYRVTRRDGGEPKAFKVEQLVDQGMARFVRYVQLNALQFLKFGQEIVASMSRAILLVFMTLMVAGYLMHTRDSILGFFRSLAPKMYRPGFDFLLRRIDRGLSGVVRGQLLICLVNGVLSAIGFAVLGLKYWPVLALLAGLMSIIPIFGSILSTVPAVLIAITQDIWLAFWVLIWILGIHQVEANLLNPKIIGVAAKIHPVLVVFALLVGEHYFGLWGALLAVPVLSITQSVFNHFRHGLPDVEADSLTAPELIARSSAGH